MLVQSPYYPEMTDRNNNRVERRDRRLLTGGQPSLLSNLQRRFKWLKAKLNGFIACIPLAFDDADCPLVDDVNSKRWPLITADVVLLQAGFPCYRGQLASYKKRNIQ